MTLTLHIHHRCCRCRGKYTICCHTHVCSTVGFVHTIKDKFIPSMQYFVPFLKFGPSDGWLWQSTGIAVDTSVISFVNGLIYRTDDLDYG